MQLRPSLSCAGLLVCCLSFAAGQTTPPPDPQQTQPQSVPPAQPQPSIPAIPPYTSPEPAPGVAPAQQAPAPAVPPVKPTPAAPFTAYVPYGTPDEDKPVDRNGSTYVPVDSWIYPAMTRLYSLGYADRLFLGMRPWTRRSLLHALQTSEDAILSSDDSEAREILDRMLHELEDEVPSGDTPRGTIYGLYSGYTRLQGIGGPVLRDSYHIGQTINNDYGRPYATGFNNLTGFSTVDEWKRFSFHLRGEYQHAPGYNGYTNAVAAQLAATEEIGVPPTVTQSSVPTLPIGPQPAQNPFRLVEGSVSFHLLDHEFSGGKTDAWLGPAQGGAMAWSNNAENIYSFRINRVEPLTIPLVSRVLGPVRYDFFYGALAGHTIPRSPYIHSEMFSFRPSGNFEFGFQRTIIFGGNGHEPVTLSNFFRGFFSINDTAANVKNSPKDPGARFSDFNFSYRLPYVRKYMTFYVDSISHDDVTPISAPRRAAFRTGLYLSQFPRYHKLDLRVEAVQTDPRVARSNSGQFNYFEIIQLQGYTNKGFILGDWIGREAKGGQAWLTYHLSGSESVQIEYLNKKTPKDFVPLGTTQNEFKVEVVKRLQPQLELDAWAQYEKWKAPLYKPGANNNIVVTGQLTWYPKLHSTATP